MVDCRLKLYLLKKLIATLHSISVRKTLVKNNLAKKHKFFETIFFYK